MRGGGTDAAELAKAGVRATTMIAMPAGVVRDGLVYHTMRDTVDAIEPAAVEACLIGLALAKEIDGEAWMRLSRVEISSRDQILLRR